MEFRSGVAVGGSRAGAGGPGAIPFQPEVTIFEPTQRALIAWNGEEEILLLSTDLRASRATKVLEVMPFPAEPRIKKGDVGVFQRAVRLINSKQPRPQVTRALTAGTDRVAAEVPPPGEITFHERIGAHDVSVARVVSGDGFVEWVNDYLRRASVGNPVIAPRLRSVVQEYIDDGFCWFAFDVISLDKAMDDLLDHRENVKLRTWRVERDFASFDRDIIAQ